MKITDKMRLDFLERLHTEEAPQEWVGILYDGTIVLDEPVSVEDKYDVVTRPRPTIRLAIDAAIRAQASRGRGK